MINLVVTYNIFASFIRLLRLLGVLAPKQKQDPTILCCRMSLYLAMMFYQQYRT